MVVDVVLLRRDGAKRPRAELFAAAPMRGELRIERGNDGPRAVLGIEGAGHGSRWPTLYCCRVMVLRGNAFVVVGDEEAGKVWENRRQRQAWWCRLAV